MKTLIPLLLLALPQLALANESLYTSVDPKDCMTVISADVIENPEIDFYEAECPSLGDYRVVIEGGDLRYNLNLYYQGAQVDLNFTVYSFHDMGSNKIEWRYARDPKTRRAELKALIYRIDFDDITPAGDFDHKSQLHVVKLDGHGSCTVAVVPKSEDMNEKARKIADSVDTLSCQNQTTN